MPRPATLQDVADRAGVHRTTVSLALRAHPSIPAATRERIQGFARKLGYQANPFVTALMRSRRTGQAVKHAVLAFVSNHPTRYGWRPPESSEPDFFAGAAERAKELGYRLDHFWLAEPGMSPARFGDILSARGIHGVLIGRLPVSRHELQLDWARFSTVALGLTLEAPQLHHVGENHFHTTRHAMTECINRGYKRIGFAFSTHNDYPRVGDRWLGGYYSQQRRLAARDRLQPFQGDPGDRTTFLKWFERWRPDALLVSWAPPVLATLQAAGYKVPGDVGLVELRNEHRELGHAGMFYDPAKVGALGVEMLIGLIHRNERGVPQDPHEVLLTGTWREGWTLRSRA